MMSPAGGREISKTIDPDIRDSFREEEEHHYGIIQRKIGEIQSEQTHGK